MQPSETMNLLTGFGFGFYDPYWLLDIDNLAIVVHLISFYLS